MTSNHSLWQSFVQGSFAVRWQTFQALPKYGDEFIQPLVELLSSSDSELRWFAAKALGEFDSPKTRQVLAGLLSSPDAELRDVAMQALVRSGDHALDVLISRLADARLPVVQTLSQIYSDGTIAPLLQVLDDDDSQIRAIALGALANYPQPILAEVLVRHLQDPAAIVRCEACLGLGLMAARYDPAAELLDMVSLLAPALGDCDQNVRRQAIVALGRVGTVAAIDLLGKVLLEADTPESLQIEAARQLAWQEQPDSLDYLKTALTQATTPVTLEIIQLLGRIEEPNLQRAIVEILTELFANSQTRLQQPELRKSLAVTLGQLGHPTAQKLLIALANDQDPIVQIHGQYALQQLMKSGQLPGD